MDKFVTHTGKAVAIDLANIDTDQIIPKQFLKRIDRTGFGECLFYDWRADPALFLNDPRYAGAGFLVTGSNFGCGSSREHAPQAIRRRGIRAVVGESFSEIFFGNSVALGMPCPTVDPAAASQLQTLTEREPRTAFTLDLASMSIRGGGAEFPVALPPGARESFMDGSWDATGLLLERYDEVRAVAARLPYVSGTFTS